MKFIDICSGIGGFRSGFEKAGHECIGYVENDKYARKSYEAMYDTENEWTAEDITKLTPEEIPQADMWCFGFPCQDISVAGSQKGLKGERSGIFHSIIELLKGKSAEDRPRYLVIENVKNLLSLHGGREFTEVLYQISEAGYDAQWYLINSKDHGVPQNRERVFIIANLRERGGFKVLSQTRPGGQTCCERQTQQQTCEGKDKSKRQEKYGDRFQHMIGNRKYQSSHVYGTGGVSRACDTSGEIYYAIPTTKAFKEDTRTINTIATGINQRENIQTTDGLARTLTATDYKEPQSIAVPKIKQIIRGVHQQDAVYMIDGISRTLTSAEGGGIGGGVRTGLYAIPYMAPDRLNKKQNGRRFKDNEDPMFTLTAQDRHGVLIYKGEEYYIRRLTPRECFRLQGFTDEQFEKAQAVNSNTQLYKQAGNAVTVNVAYQIGMRLSCKMLSDCIAQGVIDGINRYDRNN